MRYNRLKDIGLSDNLIKENLLFTAEKVGEPMKIAMTKKDAKAWFGVAPPDLSVEVRARGADWIYSYLRGYYRDSSSPTGWNNTIFEKTAMPHILWKLQGDQKLNPEHQTLEIIKPGSLSVKEYDALVGDLVNYLTFMSEPSKLKRLHMGYYVLLFLGLLLVLTVKLKKEFWKDIK
jgi:ubiquinol-cytochrome c reductase cytochrome c1 subunit